MARARDASVSMIRFIHNICIGLRIYCFKSPAPTSVIHTATTFTVNWNWMNLRMESYILRPHSTAFTIDVKLSLRSMISAAYLAT